jgi:hypothetical protein
MSIRTVEPVTVEAKLTVGDVSVNMMNREYLWGVYCMHQGVGSMFVGFSFTSVATLGRFSFPH